MLVTNIPTRQNVEGTACSGPGPTLAVRHHQAHHAVLPLSELSEIPSEGTAKRRLRMKWLSKNESVAWQEDDLAFRKLFRYTLPALVDMFFYGWNLTERCTIENFAQKL
jgi:hypothetical protein